MGLAYRVEVLVKTVGAHMLHEVPPAQSRGNLTAQHCRVAAGDIGALPRIGQTSGELLPPVDNLDLVEKEEALLTRKLLLDKQKVIEILARELGEALVFEVDVYDALPCDAGRDEVSHHRM